MTDKKLILSLFDFTGAWSKPYREAGYDVIQVDIKLGIDILEWDYKAITRPVHGILNATPCTAYSLSGTRWWAEKDSNGTTDVFDRLTRKGLEIINYFKPKWWVLENPIGRIDKRIPELKPYRRMEFDPCDFGDPYTKRTRLWGEFSPFLIRTPVPPTEGSKMHLLPPGPDRARLRSATPEGFSRAVFEANHRGQLRLLG